MKKYLMLLVCMLLVASSGIAGTSETLRDRNGNKLGTIDQSSNGILVGRDKNGNKVGDYDSKSNITRDRNGNKVGQGNLLSSLIVTYKK